MLAPSRNAAMPAGEGRTQNRSLDEIVPQSRARFWLALFSEDFRLCSVIVRTDGGL
jgi:hypothetical protein